MCHVTKKNTSFDETVSFVIIPRLSDICPTYPGTLFYNKKDFEEMQGLARKDAEKMNRKKTKASKETKPSSNDDGELCSIGIEHRICTPKERFDREAKSRAAIESVLREQGRQRRRHSAPCNGIESALAKASIKATKEAVIRARERAAHVERHCEKDIVASRRISAPPTIDEGRNIEKGASWTTYF